MAAPPPLSKGTSLASYVRALRAIGTPVDSGLRRVKLPTHVDEHLDAWLPYAPMRVFLADMCAREGVTDLGDRASDLATHGCVDPRFRAVVLSAPTLYHALEVFAQQVKFQSTGISVWLERRGDVLRICHTHVLGPEVPGCAILDAHASRQCVDFVRGFLGPTWIPSRVVCRVRPASWRERPAPKVPFTDLGVPSEVHPHHGGIDIPVEKVWTPNPGHRAPNPEDAEFAYPTRMGSALRSCLAAYIPAGRPRIELAAEMMGCSSVRVLQRTLHEEHTCYKDVLALATLDVARQYLERPDVALTEIAFMLGYSEQSAFTRAFRGWMGASPRAYRKHWLRRPVSTDKAPNLREELVPFTGRPASGHS